MPASYNFASDNTAGVCPEAWDALSRANAGFCASYGDDDYTARAADAFRAWFETDCDVYFAFTGTAANAMALATLCQSYHAVVCADCAHIETDECGAPEFFSNGSKIWLAAARDGKVPVEELVRLATRRTDIHYPRPRVLSLTAPTELGTVYRPEEVAALSEAAHAHGLHVHMDGARIFNALATLQVSPRTLTWEAGVDVVCVGGSKAGLGFGEAIVFFDRKLSEEFAYRCKQAGQLASKMRYLTAPWADALAEGYALRHAAHANACAQRLAAGLAAVPGVKIVHPVEANAVFADLPEDVAQRIRSAGWRFYSFIGRGSGAARFMCSWATTLEDVDELVAAAAN